MVGLAAVPGSSRTLLAGLEQGTAPRRFEFAEVHMGTVARIALYTDNAADAERAARAAFLRIHNLDLRLSDYRDDSEVNTIVRAGTHVAVPVSEDLFGVLERAAAIARLADGAFDVTTAPVVQLWRRARRTGRLPDRQRLNDALSRTGYRHLRLDAARRTVTFERDGMRLDLGGIAKGYAADHALAVLGKAGMARALVALGGDIAVGEPPPDQPGWAVALAGRLNRPPMRVTRVGVSTSGDAEQHVEIDGVRYSHVIDPRTGIPVRRRSSVTVIAEDATAADSIATAVSVLGPGKGLALVDATAGASAMMTVEASGISQEYRSSRWGGKAERRTNNE